MHLLKDFLLLLTEPGFVLAVIHSEGTLIPPPGERSAMAGKVSGFVVFVSLCGNRKMHFRKDFFRFLTETAAFLFAEKNENLFRFVI